MKKVLLAVFAALSLICSAQTEQTTSCVDFFGASIVGSVSDLERVLSPKGFVMVESDSAKVVFDGVFHDDLVSLAVFKGKEDDFLSLIIQSEPFLDSDELFGNFQKVMNAYVDYYGSPSFVFNSASASDDEKRLVTSTYEVVPDMLLAWIGKQEVALELFIDALCYKVFHLPKSKAL